MMDKELKDKIGGSIASLLPPGREHGALRAAEWVARELKWELRHTYPDDGGRTLWGDVADMVCRPFEGQAGRAALMVAVERGISPLTLEDPVFTDPDPD